MILINEDFKKYDKIVSFYGCYMPKVIDIVLIFEHFSYFLQIHFIFWIHYFFILI